jgi:hypothetical protein
MGRIGVPYEIRTRVTAVKEAQFTVIQRNSAAWMALYRTLRTHRHCYWTFIGRAKCYSRGAENLVEQQDLCQDSASSPSLAKRDKPISSGMVSGQSQLLPARFAMRSGHLHAIRQRSLIRWVTTVAPGTRPSGRTVSFPSWWCGSIPVVRSNFPE